MFKVLLVIYVLGGGRAELSGGTTTYNTSFEFQEFHSMADCEQVRTEMKDLYTDWHRGGKEEDIVQALYSSKCVEMTATPPTPARPVYISPDPVETEPAYDPPPPSTMRQHKRWDD